MEWELDQVKKEDRIKLMKLLDETYDVLTNHPLDERKKLMKIREELLVIRKKYSK